MISLWEDASLPHFPRLRGDTKTDVLIVGGGMAGLLTAFFLRQAGIHCIVAEAAQISSGTTKGTTAKVTSQHGLIYRKMAEKYGTETAGLYLEANEKAIRAFRELCRETNCSWEDQDALLYSPADRGSLEAELKILQSLHFPAKYEENLPLPFSTVGAVKFPSQGQFHPLKFLNVLTEGLLIYENTPVREIRNNYAVTDHGIIFADSFIVATHFPFLNKHGSSFLKLYQSRSYVLGLENTPAFPGIYRDADEKGLSFRHYGSTLLLGGGGHRTGKESRGWAELEEKAQEYWPGAVISLRWAAQDCMSLDGMPYIGQYSKNTPNLYVATGFSKWGMTSSMVSAKILTDLVQRIYTPYAEIFSPSRSMLHKQLGVNLLESTKNLLTPTTPRCPHLGCALKWNKAERSWDCPCHGSRFQQDGTLIENPSTGDLQEPPKKS